MNSLIKPIYLSKISIVGNIPKTVSHDIKVIGAGKKKQKKEGMFKKKMECDDKYPLQREMAC